MPATQLALVSHADLLRHSARGHVAWEDQADQARGAQPFVRMTGDRCGGFGRESLAPQALVDHVGDLDFVEAVERPRQQSATTDELPGGLVDGGPETELRAFGMTVPEPLELLTCFLARPDTVG